MKTSLQSLLLIAVACVLFNSTGRSQPGSVDPSFDPGASVDFTVWPIAVQSDGKIVIGGSFATPHCGITRLNPDGTVDATFNPGTGVNQFTYLLGLSYIYSIVIQPDGKILIGGDFTTFNGSPRNNIARLDPDGTLDTGFDPGSGTDGVFGPEVFSIALQPDGKILIAGQFNTVNGTTRNRVARLHSDGSLDTNFNTFNNLGGEVRSLVLQPDNKILIGGNFNTTNGNHVTRLNEDGSFDASFKTGTGVNSYVQSLALQADGKVLIGGNFSSVNGTNRNRIARLNTDGSLDTTFAPGFGANNIVNALALQSDGAVLLGGNFTSINATNRTRVARLLPNGSLDTSFNPGSGANGVIYGVSLTPDARIVIGGYFTSFNNVGRNFIAGLQADGALDESFNPGSSEGAKVYSVVRQSDGRVIVGGTFTNFNRTAHNRIARLNPNGTLDPSFNAGTGIESAFAAEILAMDIQSDQNILVGGVFTTVGGATRNGLARLHANGTLDSDYNPVLFSFSSVRAIKILPDQKALVGGSFNSINGITRPQIARLHSNGSLDETFNSGFGPNSAVRSIAVRPDGKVIITGDFTGVNNTNRFYIACLEAEGPLDTSFTANADFAAFAVAALPDGKIVVGGQFNSINGIFRDGIARLNSDGSVDTNFVPPHLVGFVHALAVQPDGKVIIGGDLPNFSNKRHVARLNANGTLDTSFNPGFGAHGSLQPLVHSVVLQPDSRVLIGGAFTTVNRQARWWIARLFGDVPVLYPPIVMEDSITVNWSAITGRTYRVQFKQDLNATNWTDLPPDIIAPGSVASQTNTLHDPQRFYRVKLLSE